MRTVAEPKVRLGHLWTKPSVREGVAFRLMRYTLWFEHNGRNLLHNVVTGELILLDQSEQELLERLPGVYTAAMDPLIDRCFLVPADTDEHKRVAGLREMLTRMNENKSDGSITFFTILTTTACNARCFYCFEKGIQTMTMSKQTAADTAAFIFDHCKGKKVLLDWFGGEPTVAADRMDWICEDLNRRGVEFSSSITTNAYLFDQEMAEKARSLWRLESAMITVDGTEESYNRIKAYVNADGSPYQRVMRNIGLLLDRGVRVGLRMNFDQSNYHLFKDLVREAKERYGQNPLVNVYVHEITDGSPEGVEDPAWISEKILELNRLAQEEGMYHPEIELPSLKFGWCAAARGSAVTIMPNGKLVSCAEKTGPEEYKGDLIQGVTDRQLVSSWQQLADIEKCWNCELYPNCMAIEKCGEKGYCFYKPQDLYRARKHAEQLVDQLVDTLSTK